MDWAFEQPHYLQGWAITVDQTTDRNFDILEGFYSGHYGQCWNLTSYLPSALNPFWTGYGFPESRRAALRPHHWMAQ